MPAIAYIRLSWYVLVFPVASNPSVDNAEQLNAGDWPLSRSHSYLVPDDVLYNQNYMRSNVYVAICFIYEPTSEAHSHIVRRLSIRPAQFNDGKRLADEVGEHC